MRSTVSLVLALSLTAAACGSPRDLSRELKPGSGFIQVPGGRVWYNVVGTGHRTPLLVLHGGPGGSSYYLKPLGALGDDRPVIFYDQLGGGHSDKPADSTLWTMERFVQEGRLTLLARPLAGFCGFPAANQAGDHCDRAHAKDQN